MLFGLQYVDHPFCRIHEAVEHFVQESCQGVQFTPAIFPEWFRNVPGNAPALNTRFRALHDAILALGAAGRLRFRDAFDQLNRVQELCEQVDVAIPAVDGPIAEAMRDLLDYMFDTVVPGNKTLQEALGVSGDIVRDYFQTFRKQNSPLCPFCGLACYNPPKGGGRRTAYDHYLYRGTYACSVINPMNLVPMCDGCNEPPSKGQKDVLAANGQRRRAYYPYAQAGGIGVSATCAQLPSIDNANGEWIVTVHALAPAEQEQVDVWKWLFRFPDRYSEHLSDRYESWARLFTTMIRRSSNPQNVPGLTAEMASRAQDWRELRDEANVSEAVLQVALLEFLASAAAAPLLSGMLGVMKSEYGTVVKRQSQLN